MLRELWRYRALLGVLVTKELKLRYRRSVLGFAWTMLNPLLTMLILTLVFSHAMRVQLESFPAYVLCALLPWNFFAQSLVGGSQSLLSNESLLRTVKVPRAIFPISMVVSHLVNLTLALVPFALVLLWQGVPLTAVAPLALVSLFFLALFTTGVVLAFSAWTVFFRDLTQLLEVGLPALFYLTPIIYPLSILPENYRRFFEWNPLTRFITPWRTLLLDGTLPPFSDFWIPAALAVGAFAIGVAVFRRYENDFLVYLS